MLTGSKQIFASGLSAVDTTATHALGTKAFDDSGNEYIYLKGIGSTGVGSVVKTTFLIEAHSFS